MLSVCRFTQEEPQQDCPGPQSGPVPPQLQLPETQLSPESQVTLQAPQFDGSVAVFTQPEPQQISGVSQLGPIPPQRQSPPTQNSPLSQVVVQSPQ